MPSKRTTSEPARPRSLGGRPRKYTQAELVDAALRVMEREGYGALTIRALAQELGTSHSTLYNYVGHVEDIESQAMHRLTAQLPLPTASTAAGLRKELLAYLLAASKFLAQHPGVLFPPVGSASWQTLFEIGERWIEALRPYAPDEKTARLGMGALVSLVVVHGERERVYGNEFPKLTQKMLKSPLGMETFEEMLEAMMDLVLPALSPARKAAR